MFARWAVLAVLLVAGAAAQDAVDGVAVVDPTIVVIEEGSGEQIAVIYDDDVDALPSDRAAQPEESGESTTVTVETAATVAAELPSERAAAEEHETIVAATETAPTTFEFLPEERAAAAEETETIVVATEAATTVESLPEERAAVEETEPIVAATETLPTTVKPIPSERADDAEVTETAETTVAAETETETTVAAETETAATTVAAVDATTAAAGAKCEVLKACSVKEDCVTGTCIGAFVGRCNCAACLNLLPCEEDTQCGGLRGACNKDAKQCKCWQTLEKEGFSILEAASKLCNVQECSPASDSCFGLPCHTGTCMC